MLKLLKHAILFTFFWIAIKGDNNTFGTYSNSNNSLLYVCPSSNQIHFTIVRETDLYSNFITALGVIQKNESQMTSNLNMLHSFIDFEMFAQSNGEIYISLINNTFIITTNNSIKLTFQDSIGEVVKYEFNKINDTLILNENWNNYQCAIPWNDDITDSYPLSFASDKFDENSYFPNQRDVEIYYDPLNNDNNVDGCWGYIDEDNGEYGLFYGVIYNKQTLWNNKLYLHAWYDIATIQSDPNSRCIKGSQISVRVERNILLISYECSNGVYGGASLLYTNDQFTGCPVALKYIDNDTTESPDSALFKTHFKAAAFVCVFLYLYF